MRARVYLTLSPRDADLLADGIEHLMGMTDESLGQPDAAQRFAKMHERLRSLIEAHTPSLADGAFGEPPDDYAE